MLLRDDATPPPATNSGAAYATVPGKAAGICSSNGGGFVRHQPGETEINHLQVPLFCEKDVFRLNVPVNDAARMRVLQRIGELCCSVREESAVHHRVGPEFGTRAK